MHVTFNLKASFIPPFITINAPAETPELQHLATNISQLTNSQLIAGISPRGTRELVPVNQIIRIHTDAKHVVMETKATSYTLTQRIYQLKQLLPSESTSSNNSCPATYFCNFRVANWSIDSTFAIFP